MTGYLVRVTSTADVVLALQAGADIVEFEPSHTGADALARAHAIRALWPGLLRLRFAEASTSALAFSVAARADECALPIEEVGEQPPSDLALIGLMPAKQEAMREDLAPFADRLGAVMLVFDQGAPVFTTTDIAALDALASRCAAQGLKFEIGGHIEAPDISRLLLLSPRNLAFHDTVRSGPDGELDPAALEGMRVLIPRASSSGAPDAFAPGTGIDRIFVRDFIVNVSIGAYHAERRGEQRVRFDVEVDVARHPQPPRDMRDVFSYDIVIELIRVLARRGHVLFVETLAEDLAIRILAHAAVVSTTIRVSKLDVIDGAVGIEIRRDRRSR